MSFDKIYEDAKDLHVKKYVVYGDDNGDLYSDSDLQTRAKQVDIVDAFNKGLLMIVQGDISYIPVAMAVGLAGPVVKTVGGLIDEWNTDEKIISDRV